jgi:hypothetical protein
VPETVAVEVTTTLELERNTTLAIVDELQVTV